MAAPGTAVPDFPDGPGNTTGSLGIKPGNALSTSLTDISMSDLPPYPYELQRPDEGGSPPRAGLSQLSLFSSTPTDTRFSDYHLPWGLVPQNTHLSTPLPNFIDRFDTLSR